MNLLGRGFSGCQQGVPFWTRQDAETGLPIFGLVRRYRSCQPRLLYLNTIVLVLVRGMDPSVLIWWECDLGAVVVGVEEENRETWDSPP